MSTGKGRSDGFWIDVDEGSEWPNEVFERAEARDGDIVLRSSTGTLTRTFEGIKAELQQAFSTPDSDYIEVAEADVIARNKTRRSLR